MLEIILKRLRIIEEKKMVDNAELTGEQMNEVNEANPANETSDVKRLVMLPCPFCGSAANLLHRGTNNQMDNNWTVACETAECFVGTDGADWYLPKKLAAKMWNTRAT